MSLNDSALSAPPSPTTNDNSTNPPLPANLDHRALSDT